MIKIKVMADIILEVPGLGNRFSAMPDKPRNFLFNLLKIKGNVASKATINQVTHLVCREAIVAVSSPHTAVICMTTAGICTFFMC